VSPRDALLLIAAYQLGSVPVAFLAARRYHVDIRTVGSGNVGATNVFRVLGARAGAVTLALDMAKGAAAVLVAQAFGAAPAVVSAAGVGAVVGHIFPAWLRFRGGKGVAAAAGVFLVMAPASVAAAFLGFLAALGATRYVSVASLTAAAVLVAVIAVRHPASSVLAAAAACAILVVYAHRANVARVLRGTEPKLGAPLAAGKDGLEQL
jgi:glycerol-3-phosphate acyltransferase PlsY